MFQYYFTQSAYIPPGIGFRHYGPLHLAWLVGILFFCIWICRYYRRLPVGKRRLFQKRLCVLMLLMEAYKYTILIATGTFSAWYLPFHLCSMAVFISSFHAFHPTDASAQLLYSLCLPGAAAALLFPDWVEYPLINFMHLHSFLIHGLLVAYPCMLLYSKELRPQVRSLWKCALFLLLVAPPVYLFNKMFHTNFLFINRPSAGSPLSWMAAWLGNPGYLLGYGVLLLLVWTLLYLPFFHSARQIKRERRP